MSFTQGILGMARTGYSLIRWSDGPQKFGRSHDRQDDFALRWCRENNIRLDDSMSMVLDGESAFRGHHRKHLPGSRKKRALADFLDAIKVGRVSKGSILIVENIDRLSREDIDEAWEFFRSILKAGIDIVTESPQRHYTKESLKDLFCILELKFCMYRAHEESLLKSKRVRDAWEKKKFVALHEKVPISKNAPGWIELRDGKYHLVKDRAIIARRIIDLSLADGFGPCRIAGILTEEGISCFGRKGIWTASYIRVILTSTAIYGAFEPGSRNFESGKIVKTGEIVENYYPPIATKEEWLILQGARLSRKRNCGRPQHNESNLFTGFIFDAETKEKMSIRAAIDSKTRTPRIYLAVKRGKKRNSCLYYPVRDGIVRALGDLKPEDILPACCEVDKRLRRINELTKDVMMLADRRSFLEDQQNDPSTDADLLPSVQKGIIEVSRKYREKAKQLRELEEEAKTNQTKSLGACQSALELLDTPERRRIARRRINQLVEGIYVFPQAVNREKKIVHVQIYLRGGRRLYRQILPTQFSTRIRVWQLGNCDFRCGDVGNAAREASQAQLVG